MNENIENKIYEVKSEPEIELKPHQKQIETKPEKTDIKQSKPETSLNITDDHMCPEMIVKWIGHAFICPACSNYIMHNMEYCAGCGRKVTISSAIVERVNDNLFKRKENAY